MASILALLPPPPLTEIAVNKGISDLLIAKSSTIFSHSISWALEAVVILLFLVHGTDPFILYPELC